MHHTNENFYNIRFKVFLVLKNRKNARLSLRSIKKKKKINLNKENAGLIWSPGVGKKNLFYSPQKQDNKYNQSWNVSFLWNMSIQMHIFKQNAKTNNLKISLSSTYKILYQ